MRHSPSSETLLPGRRLQVRRSTFRLIRVGLSIFLEIPSVINFSRNFLISSGEAGRFHGPGASHFLKGPDQNRPSPVTRYERFVNAVAIRKKVPAASIHIGSPCRFVPGIKIASFQKTLRTLKLLRSYLQPNATSRIIITVKPDMVAMVTRSVFASLSCDFGISSSTTTKIMAPAAKQSV